MFLKSLSSGDASMVDYGIPFSQSPDFRFELVRRSCVGNGSLQEEDEENGIPNNGVRGSVKVY